MNNLGVPTSATFILVPQQKCANTIRATAKMFSLFRAPRTANSSEFTAHHL